MTRALNSRAAADRPLGAVLEAAAAALTAPDDKAVTLIYTPQRCTFGLIRSGDGLSGPPASPLGDGAAFSVAAIACAYEVRVFHPLWEIRWLRQGATGRAALLWDEESEDTSDGPATTAFDDLPLRPAIVLRRTLCQRYVLWGMPAADPSGTEGWVKLTSDRVGTMWAPLPPPQDDKARAVLHVREYLATLDHGNVAVIEERLSHLAWDTDDDGAKSGEPG